MRERRLRVGAIELHLLEDGPPGGPLVLLLHGFPEIAWSWRHALPALAARGYHAVAPDLRGYGESDKPPRVADYDLDVLAGDVRDLVRALGHTPANVVGHDWGGAIAWHAAMQHPELVERLAIVACPHPQILARALLTDGRQLARSWYMLFFQLPWLPERLLAGPRVVPWMLSWGLGAHRLTDEDRRRYGEAAARPGAMRAAVSYYRAAFRRWRRALDGAPVPVRAATLVVWGGADRILGRGLLAGLERLVDGPLRIEILPGVGHFVQQEAPAAVNRLLLEHLAP